MNISIPGPGTIGWVLALVVLVLAIVAGFVGMLPPLYAGFYAALALARLL